MGQKDSCCYKERRERGSEKLGQWLHLGVSVSLSWPFFTAECVGAAAETDRGRDEERMRAAVREAAGRQRNKLYRRDLGLVSSR